MCVRERVSRIRYAPVQSGRRVYANVLCAPRPSAVPRLRCSSCTRQFPHRTCSSTPTPPDCSGRVPRVASAMSIIYSLIARGNIILAEYTSSSGNFTTITQSILDRIPEKDAKCTYVYDRSGPDVGGGGFNPQRRTPCCSPLSACTATSSTTCARMASCTCAWPTRALVGWGGEGSGWLRPQTLTTTTTTTAAAAAPSPVMVSRTADPVLVLERSTEGL